MSVRGFQMALVCQKVVSQLRNTLRNGALAAKLEVFTLWDFGVVSQLRNEVHCAAKWHSCAKRGFAAAKIFVERGLRLRNLADPCFSPVFALFLTRFCSERLPFNFFAFSPDFDNPKTYITSKQIRIKALKSKLKHLNQN